MRQRRLVGNEGSHLLRVLSHQGKGVDGATAGGEQVYGSCVEGGDEPVQVVCVHVWRRLGGVVGQSAALGTAGVVGHDSAVGEVSRQSLESGGTHR